MVVLDSSALLALLLGEPGAEQVAAVLDDARISAVNLAEVLTRFVDRGADPDEAGAQLLALHLAVEPVTAEQAVAMAALRPATRAAGLSLGDRACLALARTLGAPALTADRAWAAVAPDVGVDIRLIRAP